MAGICVRLGDVTVSNGPMSLTVGLDTKSVGLNEVIPHSMVAPPPSCFHKTMSPLSMLEDVTETSAPSLASMIRARSAPLVVSFSLRPHNGAPVAENLATSVDVVRSIVVASVPVCAKRKVMELKI